MQFECARRWYKMWIFYKNISIESLLVYENKYYLQVYLDNCAYKNISTEMVHDLADNIFESDKWVL